MMSTLRFLLPACALLASLGCSAAGTVVFHRDNALREIEGTNYRLAYVEARAALDSDPSDPELQKLAQELRILWLLDEQRKLIFLGKEEAALELLARVLTIDPSNPVAKRWREKARAQIGARLILEGEEHLKAEELDQALAKFQKALSYAPGDPKATGGLRTVSTLYNEQREHAKRHYHRALGAREELDWARVFYHSKTTKEADPTHEDAPRLHELAERRVAETERRWARKQQELGLWGAASKSWTKAADLAEEAGLAWHEEARKRAKEMADEAEACRLFERAEVRIAAWQFDEARQLIAKGDPICRHDRVYVNELLGMLARAEVAAGYERAKLLELDHRYEAALDEYEKLAPRDPAGPAAAKVKSIRELLAGCAAQYADADKALAAGDAKRAREIWREVLAVHPRYKDVRARFDASNKDASDPKPASK